MKKVNRWLFCLTLGFALIACNSNNDEAYTKKVVGKFVLAERQTDLEIALEVKLELMLEDMLDEFEISTDMSIEYTDDYLPDHTMNKNGTITIRFLDEEFDIIYGFSVSGKWRIENSKVVYSHDVNQLKIQYVSNNASSVTGKFLVMFEDKISESLYDGMKEYLLDLESDSPKITKLNNNELVLNIDGEQVVYKKLGT